MSPISENVNGSNGTTRCAKLNVPLWINGKEETRSDTFNVVTPYTNDVCWTAAAGTPEDGIKAVEAAEAAFPAWSQTKPTVRRDILLKAADLLESQLEELAQIMRTEMGADVGTSQFFVTPLAIRMLRDIAGRITSICGSVPVVEAEGQSAIVYKEPMGIILGIVPWNAPYVFGIRSVASALATGNTTIIKASDLSPRCYWAIGKAFADAGLPAGCLNVMSCKPQDAAQVVNAMIEHPAVKKVNFTGSTAVGRHIAVACAKVLKPCLMELGGKNSAIVCEDADFNIAVPSVIAGFSLNAGQICMSTDRILIHASIADEFIVALKTALTHGASAEIPKLVTAASKARIQRIVSSAISSGAHIIYGDKDSTREGDNSIGSTFTPVVLGGVREDMDTWQEEAFAPLAACMIVKDVDEAIRVANRGGYGLSASVFTKDLRKGLALAKKLESGAVHINSMTVHDEPVLPHGGVKNSGWGRFNGNHGLEEFLVTKSVTWLD